MLALLFRFSGRIGRARFWGGTLLSFVLWVAVSAIVPLIDAAITGTEPHPAAGLWVTAVTLAYVWSFLAICTKRFHDHDSSAAWCLILLVPAIGVLFFLIELGMIRGTRGDNRYGADPVV